MTFLYYQEYSLNLTELQRILGTQSLWATLSELLFVVKVTFSEVGGVNKESERSKILGSRP
jgi:hypothetical protein